MCCDQFEAVVTRTEGQHVSLSVISLNFGGLYHVEGDVVPDVEPNNAKTPFFDTENEMKDPETDPQAHHMVDQIQTLWSVVLAVQGLGYIFSFKRKRAADRLECALDQLFWVMAS